MKPGDWKIFTSCTNLKKVILIIWRLIWKRIKTKYFFKKITENSDEPRSISKRDVKDNEIQNDEDDEDDGNLDVISDLMGLEGESKCKARLFSCLGNVAKGSMHYMNEPGGVTG